MSLAFTICHLSASLVMPIGDSLDGFFYPTFTFMMDPYISSPELLECQPRRHMTSKQRRINVDAMCLLGWHSKISHEPSAQVSLYKNPS